MRAASADVGFVVVELEVDLSSQTLQVGDQRVHFCGLPSEVSRDRLRVSLLQLGDRLVVGAGLRTQVVARLFNHILTVGHAGHRERPQMLAEMRAIQHRLFQPGIARHDRTWNDGARVAQVVVDLRAYRFAHDPRYAQAALEHAVDPTFPLIHLSDVTSGQLYDYALSVKDEAQADPGLRSVAAEILRRRDATAQLREIGHVRALSHRFHLSITAPADEYFGPSKLSVLGIRNEIDRIEAYIRAGWGSRLVEEGQQLAAAVEELHRVYPRDFELPRLFVNAAGVLDRIPSTETEASAQSLRRTLVVEYPDSPQARALL